MQLKALNIEWDKVPSELESFISPNQTFITPGKEYFVYALSIYIKIVFALVIDDLNTPVFLPASIFETISPEVPCDWICNLGVDDDLEMILGPEFIAKDLEAYSSMVDQESDQVERFWIWSKKEKN